MRRLLLECLALPLFAAACSQTAAPLPQWTVVISTDAPVPRFGNRLLIEVLTGAGQPACSACRRQFGADDPTRYPISFGIEADGQTLRLRVRLFRAILIGADGIPSGAALIDRTVTLPSPTGDMRVAVDLPMRCFGSPADVPNRMSCDPRTGELAPEPLAPAVVDADLLKVGTWGPAATTTCEGETPSDMICIPGGAFLLGDPTVISLGGFGAATTPEHLVQLSPFRIDREEMSVASFLELRMAHPELDEPLPNGSPISGGNFCTYQGSDPAMPLNCLSRSLAEAICKAQGKRLPREAEWEYAAGNLGEESPYPWGSVDAICQYAVVARDDVVSGLNGPSLCRIGPKGTLPGGPAPGGAELDVTVLGVHNLGGNLSEWTEDAFAPYTDACWGSQQSVLFNPTCKAANPFAAVRGGNWGVLRLKRMWYRASPNRRTSPARSSECAAGKSFPPTPELSIGRSPACCTEACLRNGSRRARALRPNSRFRRHKEAAGGSGASRNR